ncbi:hypothetical protein C5Y97_03545 [Blastopirellula marina]|uniref:Uncharacterized protein n=1 Tax=Blastopirellula marina TaxID=124 RepID=A0A2S8G9R7_9BACT|nr:hypothetical protein C5Y98_03545 [Blastopirellula marina]PTL45926.1 hypothetical protein C5Y97_03545 [Blastopirellula marina]
MDHDELQSACEKFVRLRRTVEELILAFEYAADTKSNVWDFAVSIQQLRRLGATETDLRWLIRKGIVVHGREVTVRGDNGREFRSTGNLTFSRRTCFVLTEAGRKNVNSEYDPFVQANVPKSNHCQPPGTVPNSCVPRWEADLRKLLFDQQLVKRFKWPAVNQEMVLCAFQEEGWPERIDDPLPPQAEQDPKRRLADTIKCLNRKQENHLIHFHGDGTGQGIVWERVDPSGSTSEIENNRF